MYNRDRRDQLQSRTILVVLAVALLATGFFVSPMLAEFSTTKLEPGLGLKDAAVYAFFSTLAVLVILALAAGDGLIGELQFMLGMMFLLFFVLWIGIAWVF